MSTFQVKASITASDDGATATLNKIRGIMRSIAADSKKMGAIQLKLSGNRDIQQAARAMESLIARYDRVATSSGKAAGGIARVNALLSQQSAIVSSLGRYQTPGMRNARGGNQQFYGQNNVGGLGLHTVGSAIKFRAVQGGLTTASNVVKGGGQAIVREDTDRLRATIENLSPDLQRAINEGSQKAARDFRSIFQSDINEATRSGVANLKDQTPENAKKLAEVVASAMTLEKVRTGDSSEASRSIQRFMKAADLAGKAETTGELSKFVNILSRANLAMGRDLSSEKVLTGLRGAKTLLPTLTDKALVGLMSAIDEVGQRAGNEMNQFVDSFTGLRTNKKAKALQEGMGLRGKDGQAVDQQLLRTDPTAWLQKYLRPQMEKKGIKFDGSAEDDVNITKFANSLGLRQTAENFIVREMLKFNERQRDWAKVQRTAETTTPDKMKDVTGQSLTLAGQGLSNSLSLLADTLTRDLQPKISAAINSASSAVANASRPENIGDTANVAKYVAGLTVGAVAIALKEAMNNPTQSAHTVAMGVHSAALLKGSLPGLGNLPVGVVGAAGAGGVLATIGKFVFSLGAAAAVVETFRFALNQAEKTWKEDAEGNNPEGKPLRDNLEKKAKERQRRIDQRKEEDDKLGITKLLAKDLAESLLPPDMPSQIEAQKNLWNTLWASMNKGREVKDLEDTVGEKARQKRFATPNNEDTIGEKARRLGFTRPDPKNAPTPELKDFSEFSTGINAFQMATESLSEKGSEFGTNAGTRLEGTASTWGSTAGSALSAALQGVISQLQNITINANVKGLPGGATSNGRENP